MTYRAFRAAVLTLFVAGGPFVLHGAAQTERRPAPAPAQGTVPVRSIDADTTRREFMELLRKHPPSVARVLKLDPSLMENENYLAPYPEVRAFLAQHPEIPLNASYYLREVRPGTEEGWAEPGTERLRILEGLLMSFGALIMFVAALGAIVWFARTVIEQRRWNRLSRIQAEVHTKLMDRFAANDELLTYVQTPSARRFLEAGPSPLQEERSIGAPFARILWSVQLGVVLTVAGMGVMVARGTVGEFEVQQFLMVIGMLLIAVGLGFVLSAGAAYGISRKLGLLDRPVSTTNA
jgi:hypothetical protein